MKNNLSQGIATALLAMAVCPIDRSVPTRTIAASQ
jgi:hypothetical protein